MGQLDTGSPDPPRVDQTDVPPAHKGLLLDGEAKTLVTQLAGHRAVPPTPIVLPFWIESPLIRRVAERDLRKAKHAGSGKVGRSTDVQDGAR